MFIVEVVNKLRLQYKGTPKHLGESVTDMEFRSRKRQRGLDASIVTGDSSVDAGRCTDEPQCFLCACTVVFPLEDQSRWPWHHEMMSQWSPMPFWEGTIREEHTQTLGLLSGFSDTEWLGLLTSHRPSTLSILVPLMEQSINQNELYVSFIHIHVPRPFWGTFSQYDFSCLMLAR